MVVFDQIVGRRGSHQKATHHAVFVGNNPRLEAILAIEYHRTQARPIRREPLALRPAMDLDVHRIVQKGSRQHVEQLASLRRVGPMRRVLYHGDACYLLAFARAP